MTMDYQVQVNVHLEDINPVFAGEATCKPGQRSEPGLRTMLLHYVVSGCGILYLNGKSYRVHAGQAFLLPPDCNAYYTADLSDPWIFRWVGFSGKLAADFQQLPPVFDAPEDTLCHAVDQIEPDPMLAYLLAADLLLLYAKVIHPKGQPKNHVQKVIDYLNISYMNPLTVKDVADYVNLNQYYLSKLFKKKTGHTLQYHILTIRLEEAKRCLLLGHSIKETAALCGFLDVANFSKLFKREFGKNPTQWRNDDLAETTQAILRRNSER